MPRLLRLFAGLVMTAALAAPGLAPSVGGAITHHPRVAAKGPSGPGAGSFGWASSNWSGYAITGSGFTSVTGSWTVPTVSATSKATYSSTWIGIDGFNNSSLIQTGTEQDYFNGSAHYNAWWEILPAAETPIGSITVHPGDKFSASVTRNSGSSWTITISDKTNGQSFTTVQSYGGPGTSAEWIQEAPTVGGRIANLAHYGQTTFDPGTVNGASPRLTGSEGGVMIQHRSQVSTPSSPDGDTDGFSVAYGSTQPAPPAS
ncbi:MAG TPA: G1 family glutamic endopeptidase [Candidatus Dormibacteraeota bacterium]|nr:G1 family glutamic endopeptidase [Candidatus Dormibacteraeota bacterium]